MPSLRQPVAEAGRLQPLPTGALEGIAARMDEWLERHKHLYLAVCTLLCLVTSLGYSHAKLPWNDEVLEITLARLPGWAAIRAAMVTGIQVDPPVIHYVIHLLFGAFGDHITLARLPGIIGFALLCLTSSCLVWRHAPAVYAAAAFYLPYATFLRSWSMDARPYALLMAGAIFTLFCWDKISDPGANPSRWRIGFTLALAGTLCVHFYGIYLLMPLALGELTKLWTRKRLDWATILCIPLALIPFARFLPILRAGAKILTKHYFFPVTFQNLYNFYADATETLPMAVLLIVLAAALAFQGLPKREEFATLGERQRALLAAGAGFLLVPIVGYLAAALVTKVFVPYNHAIAALGLVLSIPLLLPALAGRSRVAGLCLFAVMFGHGMFLAARGVSGFIREPAAYPPVAALRALIPEPNPDIIIPSPLHFLPYHEQVKNDPTNNLVYLFDREKGLATAHTDTAEIVLSELRGRTDARIEPMDPYLAAHPHIYMAVMGDVKGVQEWQFHYLVEHHARLWWLGHVGDFDLYRIDVQPTEAP